MSDSSIQALSFRFAAYTLIIFGFTFGLPFLVKDGDFSVYFEDGAVEWAQFVCLLATTGLLLARAWITPPFRELLLLSASLTAFAAIREMDATLDRWVPVVGWKFAYLVLVYPIIRALRNRTDFRRQLYRFLNSPAFPVLWAGFIVAIPVAQLLGHGPLLKSLMGEDYSGIYKRIIEESGEIVGYMLLAAGAIECWFLTRNRGSGENRGEEAP